MLSAMQDVSVVHTQDPADTPFDVQLPGMKNGIECIRCQNDPPS